jgi:hypothetical protein
MPRGEEGKSLTGSYPYISHTHPHDHADYDGDTYTHEHRHRHAKFYSESDFQRELEHEANYHIRDKRHSFVYCSWH